MNMVSDNSNTNLAVFTHYLEKLTSSTNCLQVCMWQVQDFSPTSG